MAKCTIVDRVSSLCDCVAPTFLLPLGPLLPLSQSRSPRFGARIRKLRSKLLPFPPLKPQASSSPNRLDLEKNKGGVNPGFHPRHSAPYLPGLCNTPSTSPSSSFSIDVILSKHALWGSSPKSQGAPPHSSMLPHHHTHGCTLS